MSSPLSPFLRTEVLEKRERAVGPPFLVPDLQITSLYIRAGPRKSHPYTLKPKATGSDLHPYTWYCSAHEKATFRWPLFNYQTSPCRSTYRSFLSSDTLSCSSISSCDSLGQRSHTERIIPPSSHQPCCCLSQRYSSYVESKFIRRG